MSRVYNVTLRDAHGMTVTVEGHGNTRETATRSAIGAALRERPGLATPLTRVAISPKAAS